MYLKRLTNNYIGRAFISILLGLGLATLFRKVCKDRECIVFKAPSIDKIKNDIFKFDEKCYTFKESAQTCDDNKKIIQFA